MLHILGDGLAIPEEQEMLAESFENGTYHFGVGESTVRISRQRVHNGVEYVLDSGELRTTWHMLSASVPHARFDCRSANG